ncbi:MAG: menaquinone biosynthesis protein [Chitinophagaceae bacterium]|nr:menaquinone biosynthesis protein [Chitinophagaceae bacterium]
MAQKLKVAAVSYLNTKPLIYGFEQGMMKDELELLIEYPAKIATLLIEDKIDIGLVPVAIIPILKEYHIISDYCIGCDGEVASVCLFSDVPIEEIETILLDYQSRTSVELLKVLLKEHWKISPNLIAATENYEQQISGSTAGLVIGDRALAKRSQSKYIYDLGITWKEMTGLPFVFAAWVSNKKVTDTFIKAFNAANCLGLQKLDLIIQNHTTALYNLHKYYTENINFTLDESKKEAMSLFLTKLKNKQAVTIL